MSRATLILGPETREKAIKWVKNLPDGDIVEFRKAKRSLPQNDYFHALVTEVSTQVMWHGQKLSVDDWKILFMESLNAEMRMVPNIAGDGWTSLGRHTSKLTKEEFSGLITVVQVFGAVHGVKFADERKVV